MTGPATAAVILTLLVCAPDPTTDAATAGRLLAAVAAFVLMWAGLPSGDGERAQPKTERPKG